MKNYKDIKFALYARKSSTADDKQVQSIESQLDELKGHAKKNNLNIVKVFTDQGSAHKPNNRPNFTEMMMQLENGELDGILVWKADRLARNHLDGALVMYSLQRSKIKIIQTPYNRYLPTDNTLPLTIEFGMANQYSLDLSKNIKRGNKTKISNGGWCGVAPCGYLNDVVNKTVVVDPDRFGLVRKMWDLYKTENYSLREICMIANDDWGFRTYRSRNRGGGELVLSSLHKIFTNEFYYGRVKKGDYENWGTHKPMITELEFERVQDILRRQGRTGYSKYEFSFIGCIKCKECGSGVSASEKVKYWCPSCKLGQTGKNPHKCRKCGFSIKNEHIAKGHWYNYYGCTKKIKKADNTKCSQKSIREEKLEEQFLKILTQYEIEPEFEEWSLKWLKFINQQKFSQKKKDNSVFKRKYSESEIKLERLVDMRADGEITKEEFLKLKEKAIKERDKAHKILKEAEQDNDDWLEEAEGEFDFIEGIVDRFKNGTTKERQYIFRRIGLNFSLKDGVLDMEIKTPYVLIKELEKNSDQKIEPLESQSIIDQSVDFKKPCSNWYRQGESNPCYQDENLAS